MQQSVIPLQSKKNESRSLFKKCFKNQIFSLVPFEIWRDLIVSSADLKTIVLLSRSCFAFKEIVDEIGEKNFNLSLLFRREGQIVLAKKYLLRCVENNNATAMFYLAYSYSHGGFGVSKDFQKASEWFKKSADLDYGPSMGYYAYSLEYGFGVEKNTDNGKVWAQKALCSNNNFAIGFCNYCGLGTEKDCTIGVSYFEKSAKEGNENAQKWLAYSFRYGSGVEMNIQTALFWYLKSAEQGLSTAQVDLAQLYLQNGSQDLGRFWAKKHEQQQPLK